jgi:hypothetical protein
VQQEVMIVPVDAHVNKAEDIAEEYRQQRGQGLQGVAMRHLHFQNHDGDDDGQYAIAESFQPVFFHGILVVRSSLKR